MTDPRAPGPYTDRPTIRERIVQLIASLLHVNLLDAHTFNDVNNGRYNAFRTTEMRNHLVDLTDDAPDEIDDARAYQMHMMMLGDENVNGGSVTLTGKQNDDGTWEHEVHGIVDEDKREFRKRELLISVATRADITDVITEDALNRYGTSEENED